MKRKILFCLLGGLLLTGCSKDAILEEDFAKGLNNFIKSDANDNEYDAKLEDGKMLVTYWDKDYTLTYNLKENPTITYEFEIKKGTSYEEFLEKADTISLPMLGYIAAADTYGVGAEDAYTYFGQTYLDGMFDANSEDKTPYIVADDKEGYEDKDLFILTSEFGDKVIDYIKYTYDKDIKIEDEEYQTFTYELSTNCDKKSCTFTADLTINPEGKFEKIVGYVDQLARENMDENITPDSADYHIELVVGQSVTISGKKLNGYDKSGMDIVEIESLDSKYVFKATRAGIANGNFYIGKDGIKTFYITVTEADKDAEIEDITLKIK